MIRRRQGIRSIALAATLLLLWCHGLDASFYAHANVPIRTAHTTDVALAAPVPAPSELPELSCCFGGAGSNLLSASLTRSPTLPAPLLAGLLSSLLFLAAPLIRRRLLPARTPGPTPR